MILRLAAASTSEFSMQLDDATGVAWLTATWQHGREIWSAGVLSLVYLQAGNARESDHDAYVVARLPHNTLLQCDD